VGGHLRVLVLVFLFSGLFCSFTGVTKLYFLHVGDAVCSYPDLAFVLVMQP
jgi:hypothetical protein